MSIRLHLCAVLQVDGSVGFQRLLEKVRRGNFWVLYQGTLATIAATFIGHYPWSVMLLYVYIWCTYKNACMHSYNSRQLATGMPCLLCLTRVMYLFVYCSLTYCDDIYIYYMHCVQVFGAQLPSAGHCHAFRPAAEGRQADRQAVLLCDRVVGNAIDAVPCVVVASSLCSIYLCPLNASLPPASHSLTHSSTSCVFIVLLSLSRTAPCWCCVAYANRYWRMLSLLSLLQQSQIYFQTQSELSKLSSKQVINSLTQGPFKISWVMMAIKDYSVEACWRGSSATASKAYSLLSYGNWPPFDTNNRASASSIKKQ